MSKEIDDYINEQVAANRGTREQILQQFAKSDDAELTAYATNANKPKVEETKKTMMDLMTTPHPMLGISPADVALYGGGAALAWQAGKKLADISIQGIGNIGGQIGNAIFGKAGTSAPSPSASTQDLMATPNIEKPYPPDVQALIERSEANKAAKAADAMAKVSPLPAGMTPGIPTAQPNVSVNPTGAFTQPSGYSVATPTPVVQPSQFDPSRIGQPLQDPLAGRGFQTPQQEIGPRVPPTAVDTLAAGGTPTQIATQTAAQEIDALAPVAPPAELRTGTGKLAYAGTGPAPTVGKKGPQFKKEYASLADVPTGYALVPGGQYIDPLRNDLGQIEYTKAFTGREFPQTYEEAVAAGKDINRSLGRATREEAKAAGLPSAETTKGIAKTTTENKKLVKIIGKAGLAGALVSLADLALAKTPQEKAEAGIGLLGAVLPPGMDINAAGAGSTLSPEMLRRNQIAYENQFKLGSPYAQTPEAQAYRLRERAGAGRGIAPPSAYQR
jgi:hypothetical protein